MGLFLSPSWLHDYQDMEVAIAETGRSGAVGMIQGFAWHMHHVLGDPIVHDAMKFAAEATHRHGMKFSLEMEWSHWAAPFVEKNPEMGMWFIVPAEGTCTDGYFDIYVPYESSGLNVRVVEISAAYVFGGDQPARRIVETDYEMQRDSFSSTYKLPSPNDECRHTPFRPTNGAYYLHLTGRLKDRSAQCVRFYVAMESSKNPDVAHPDFLKTQLSLLEMYRDLPLDGVAWDEPGKPHTKNGYKAGRGFMSFFQQRCGYDLRTRLLDLDQGTSAEAFQTRNDYFTTLTAMNYRAQAEFNQKAKEIFGENIFLGNHHTFSGLGSDLRAGCSDYFHMNKGLTSAFTDTGWGTSYVGETTYNYVLAESLRKELGQPLSTVCDWSTVPHTTWYDYYTRQKFLFQHEWFMIFLGRWCEGQSTFPWSSHWPDVVRNFSRLETYAGFTERRFSGQSEMAVWHSPQSVAYLETSHYHYVRLWMTANNNLAHQAMVRSRFFDYVSGNAIENARVEDGQIHMAGSSYRRLTLPYAVVMKQAFWKKVLECVEKGVEVIFFGPPPRWILETGENLSEEFSRLCGVELLSYERYNTWLTSHKPVPALTDWEPDIFDFSFPLAPIGKTTVLSDEGGQLIGVRNPENRVTYLTALDPREQFFQQLGRQPGAGPQISHCGQGSYRLMQAKDDSNVLMLVCIAPLHERLDEYFTCCGLSFLVQGGTWVALRFENGRISGEIKDEGVTITTIAGPKDNQV